MLKHKTVIILDDDVQMVFDGFIVPEELVGLNLEAQPVESYDGFVIHTYTRQTIEKATFGKIL